MFKRVKAWLKIPKNLIEFNHFSSRKILRRLHFSYSVTFRLNYVIAETKAEQEMNLMARKRASRVRDGKAKRYQVDNNVLHGRFEVCYYIWLKRNKIKFRPGPRPIPIYMSNGTIRRYFPDFYLVDTREYIDVKPGKATLARRAKNGQGNLWKIELLQKKGLNIRITDNTDTWFSREIYSAVTEFTRKYSAFRSNDLIKFLEQRGL